MLPILDASLRLIDYPYYGRNTRYDTIMTLDAMTTPQSSYFQLYAVLVCTITLTVFSVAATKKKTKMKHAIIFADQFRQLLIKC